MIRVAATADVHSPRYLDLFKRSAGLLKEADLLVLAGDLIYKGRAEAIDEVVKAVEAVFKGPAVACFGNEEFDEVKEELKERTRGVLTWLDDESLTLTVKGASLGLVGTRGCLDQPTSWQLRNIPRIRELYDERLKVVDRLLAGLSCDYRLLLSHYAVTKETLRGERPSIWSQLGSLRMEEVVRRRRPTVAIHGHVHNGEVLQAWVDGALALNVSLPAAGRVVVFSLPIPKPTLKPKQAALTSFL
jgi:Icc-related predicted phosphoesterase